MYELYEFVCMNSYKNLKKQVGISTRDQYGLQSLQRHAIYPSTSSMGAHFIYIPYNKKTIRKMRLYNFIRVAYSHPHLLVGQILDIRVTMAPSAGVPRAP